MNTTKANPLRQAREKAGVSRVLLAASAGVSVDTVRRLESGEVSRLPTWAKNTYATWVPDADTAYTAWRAQLALPAPAEGANPLEAELERLKAQLKAFESAEKGDRLQLQSELKAWRQAAGVSNPEALLRRLGEAEAAKVALEAQLKRAQTPQEGVADPYELFLEGASYQVLQGLAPEGNEGELNKLRKRLLELKTTRKELRGLVTLINRIVDNPAQFEKVIQKNIRGTIRDDYTWRRAKFENRRLVFGHTAGEVCILAFDGRDHVYESMRGIQTGIVLKLAAKESK